MNGNDWANILNNPEDRWKGGQFKDWRTFSTEDWRGVMGKARTMVGPEEEWAGMRGRQAPPININFPEDLKAIRERKDLASEIDRILNSQDYMMLDPEGRAKVLKVLQDIQLARDKPVEGVSRVTTPTKKTTPKEEPAKREKPQGVQFRGVGEELVKEEAGKWWEDLTPEQEIAKRKAELETSDWYREQALKREYPKLRIPLEERQFEYKKETETREFAAEQERELREQFEWEEEKRIERDKLSEEKRVWTAEFGADEATRMFDERMRLFEFRKDVKDTDRQYELDVGKFGEEKAENIRKYNLDTIAEKHSWSELLHQRGFKNTEFIETSKQFWGTLDFNKAKEENRAREAGLTYELDVTKEANIMDRFDNTLKREYAQLDLDIDKFGLNVDTEERVRTLALMNVALKTEQLGLDQAIQYFKEREADRTEWWNKKENELKDKNANRLLKETEAQIIRDAKETDLATAIHRQNVREHDDKMELAYAKLDKEAEEEGVDFVLTIPPEFATTLSNLGVETQSEVMRLLKLTYDPKKGKNIFPNKTERNEVTNFLIGAEDEEVENEKLGCNLPLEDYINACLSYYDWTDQMKAYALRLKTDNTLWRGVVNTARGLDVYTLDAESEADIEETGLFETGLSKVVRRAGETVKGWFGWGREEAPAVTDFESIKTEVDALYDRTGSMADVERFLTERGMTLDEYKEQLRQRG